MAVKGTTGVADDDDDDADRVKQNETADRQQTITTMGARNYITRTRERPRVRKTDQFVRVCERVRLAGRRTAGARAVLSYGRYVRFDRASVRVGERTREGVNAIEPNENNNCKISKSKLI